MKKPIIPDDESGSDSNAKVADFMLSEKIGLMAWMDRVTAELDQAQRDLHPEVVHDLRVALRRCLSLAELHMVFDPREDWKKMRKQCRRLFKRLSELRDTQVMVEWLERLGWSQDSVGIQLAAFLRRREAKLRKSVARTLIGFNRKKWARRRTRLLEMSLSMPLEDSVYLQFALKRWQTAYDLHCQALRNRSQVAFHRLRIGLKRFRYTVENFLPRQHELWGNDLKLLQDELGEHHDLILLWQTARNLGLLTDKHVRARWHLRIDKESRIRLQSYRAKTVGKNSVWPLWRAGLRL
jgi:CHAD domain-containing protein